MTGNPIPHARAGRELREDLMYDDSYASEQFPPDDDEIEDEG